MVVTEPKSTKDVDMPEMTESNLRAALDATMSKKNDDLKLTSEEADKFKEAFEKPEFRKLMAEYVDEISDPKNKAETDAYIKQVRTSSRSLSDEAGNTIITVVIRRSTVALVEARKSPCN